MVVARSALDDLHDQLYVLACAVQDTDADLAAAESRTDVAELRRILMWLLDAARPLATQELPAVSS